MVEESLAPIRMLPIQVSIKLPKVSEEFTGVHNNQEDNLLNKQSKTAKSKTHVPRKIIHKSSNKSARQKSPDAKNLPIEALFFKEFTKALIIGMKKQRKFSRISHPVMDMEVPKISSESQKNVTIMLQSQQPEKKLVSELSRVILEPPKIPLMRGRPINQLRPINWGKQGLPPPRPDFAAMRRIQDSVSQLSLEKVRSLILNQSVSSLECPGPGKPLVITSKGVANVSNVMLGDEEISSLMKDISQRTRIPLIPGLFKAVLGSLLITAVVSDFVGTRFIIQKRG